VKKVSSFCKKFLNSFFTGYEMIDKPVTKSNKIVKPMINRNKIMQTVKEMYNYNSRARKGLDVLYSNIQDKRCKFDDDEKNFYISDNSVESKGNGYATDDESYKSFIIPEIKALAEKICLEEEEIILDLNYKKYCTYWSWKMEIKKDI
jgi:hypothetical protein